MSDLKQMSFTFEDFEEVINSLPDEDRKECFQKLEESYRMIQEAQVIYNSVITYLKIQKNGRSKSDTNGL